MYQSKTFGRHFWVDEHNDLRSCPSFIDETPDHANVDYVSEWDDFTDLTHEEFQELLNIYALCVSTKEVSNVK